MYSNRSESSSLLQSSMSEILDLISRSSSTRLIRHTSLFGIGWYVIFPTSTDVSSLILDFLQYCIIFHRLWPVMLLQSCLMIWNTFLVVLFVEQASCKLNKSFHKSYFYMLYFADRFNEVPVRSFVKTKHFSNGDIPYIINHLCFPSKTNPTRPSQ